MIKKIASIKNFAVFTDFDWDSCVIDDDGHPQAFRAINILYGRNYSGKTTLSRVFRAFETGQISDKYSNPRFSLELEDGTTLDQSRLQAHDLTVRVFNEDFIRENLRFISNPDEDIEPFAVLGKDNNLLETEIHALQAELGSNEPTKESGLYAIRKQKKQSSDSANNSSLTAQRDLDRQLTQKATGGPESIKYNPLRFGDQNYNKPKLEGDLVTVAAPTYKPLNAGKLKESEDLLEERALPDIPPLPVFESKMSRFCSETETALKKQIGRSDKIQELLNDAVLNRWVQEGRALHTAKRETCGFCGNKIAIDRWTALDRHFDKESDEFEKELGSLIEHIEREKQRISTAYSIDKEKFYARFHAQLETVSNEIKVSAQAIASELESLLTQLKARKHSILIAREYVAVTDSSGKLEHALGELDNLRKRANGFTGKLQNEQTSAKSALRLHEVHRFSKTIDYPNKLNTIKELTEHQEKATNELRAIDDQIKEKKTLIAEKKRQLNDEEEGARKVNEYLNHYFGHDFLKLEAMQKDDPETGLKRFRFQIMRGEHSAHHLSEGECRLLAFCYFMAKLEDIETKGKKPILWIDDPISSLDGNHVFFVYSIICDRLVEHQSVSQLFISTHSLDFLKYLRRLPGADNDLKKKDQKRKYQYLIVNRRHRESSIERMPTYLIEHVTEFNYLFHQVYKCSIAEEESDLNYSLFYNFGNNARKFLEMFLFYKYPDTSPDRDKLERFFGQGKMPRFLAERISNEYSHLSGVFERAATPVVVPEMQDLAKRIIECLKYHDKDQYDALLNSVGETPAYNTEQDGLDNALPSAIL